MGDVILKTENLGISFGGLKAVQDVNIEIKKKQLYGLVGPNGAGKTTVFNMLTGVYRPTTGQIYLDGENVNEEIRTLEVSNNVSVVCKWKIVRDRMVELQQKIAESKNIIMDGRDIGTVVLPNANLKIFMIASAEERAKRRMKERELKALGDKEAYRFLGMLERGGLSATLRRQIGVDIGGACGQLRANYLENTQGE